jgi:hypothetical protein
MTLILGATLVAHAAQASDRDEFEVKRRPVFEFAKKPTVAREGDRVAIRFTARGFCDATVALEDEEGRIVRHLAAGVLGPDAPPPFQKNERRQALVWDGKDDQGNYLDDKDRLRVRVSLGLRPRFERTLFWSPYRRISRLPPSVCPTPEGVYVYEGSGFNHVRLYDHEGNYVRTIYPFPSNKVSEVKGIYWHIWPQDGRRLPVKHNFPQTTFLSSGTNSDRAITYRPQSRTYESTVSTEVYHPSMGGFAATTMAVRDGRIALAYLRLNRLATDGTTGGRPIGGPDVAQTVRLRRNHSFTGGERRIPPRSSAFSPDGRWLYLAGYRWNYQWLLDGLHGVVRVDFERGGKAERFVGSLKKGDCGSEDGRFCYATSVACDAKGRVYVGDYMNDRVQVFSPDGRHLRSIGVPKPVEVTVCPRTGELYVGSWYLVNDQLRALAARRKKLRQPPPRVPAALRHYGPFDNPTQIESVPLPFERYQVYHGGIGYEYSARVDTYTDPVRVWVTPWGPPKARDEPIEKACLHIYEWRDEKLVLVRSFGKTTRRQLATLEFRPRSRLYVNPTDGSLYVACMSQPDHGTGAAKAFPYVARVDPATGRTSIVNLPLDAEDLAFDLDGRAYLRGMNAVGRFDPRTWREVPWDYGENRKTGFMKKRPELTSALPTVAGVNWHMGGIGVSPRGRFAVTTYLAEGAVTLRTDADSAHAATSGRAYVPKIYPGRSLGGKRAIVHVWDKHGRLVYEDPVPGLGILHGVQIDRHDNLYVLDTGTRVLDGKRYFNDMAGTLIKFRPGKGRVIGTKHTPVPLSPERRPDRPPDLVNASLGKAWVVGAEWLLGGVGWGGKNRGIGCDCWNCQWSLDHFARSFVPETDRYSVAVLDSAGNVILHLGRYGNVGDGRPLLLKGGPKDPRSLGGDEVALFHGAYLATDTDRRLFICDVGNARIVSVKLGYHTTETVRLGEVPDAARP